MPNGEFMNQSVQLCHFPTQRSDFGDIKYRVVYSKSSFITAIVSLIAGLLVAVAAVRPIMPPALQCSVRRQKKLSVLNRAGVFNTQLHSHSR